MYEVPGSGRHHKHRSGHRGGLRFTASDLRWATATALIPPALLLMLLLPYALIWITLILVVMLGALTVRLTRHTGGHHFTMSAKGDEPQEASEVVYDVKIVPTPEEVEAKARAKVRNLAIMATISAAAMALARHSQHQAAKSRQMHDEIDEVLGLPGTRLGYGATYQANRPRQQWEQPVITGWNWRERQEMALRGYRPTDGEPHGGNAP